MPNKAPSKPCCKGGVKIQTVLKWFYAYSSASPCCSNVPESLKAETLERLNGVNAQARKTEIIQELSIQGWLQMDSRPIFFGGKNEHLGITQAVYGSFLPSHISLCTLY
ncbi:hypothetical protein B0H14DRAFT_2565002 [Mycena olivaceomarginata]|nr:hypothetical protein B0H14DRAFT_2567434 [Mycena olivaceomarginata]KAJ7883210.1 hypothetical protein B0H14DRAFT_2565002 [Mycena olivaceomarginata]